MDLDLVTRETSIDAAVTVLRGKAQLRAEWKPLDDAHVSLLWAIVHHASKRLSAACRADLA